MEAQRKQTVRGMELPEHRRRTVGGFSLIELLIVMAVLSILAGIAVPRLRGAILKAEAADVLGDMNVIKVATLGYQADHSAWPQEAGAGQMPEGLEDYVPEGFEFRKDRYTLDYENRSSRSRSTFNIGVTFIPETEELGMAVVELVGTGIWTNGGTKFTWIIEG